MKGIYVLLKNKNKKRFPCSPIIFEFIKRALLLTFLPHENNKLFGLCFIFPMLHSLLMNIIQNGDSGPMRKFGWKCEGKNCH